MFTESQRSPEEARARLASSCVQNLITLKKVGTHGEFSFEDFWGFTDKDPSTAIKLPILNQLSRIMAHSPVETWVTYTYDNGTLNAELFQRIGQEAKSIQVNEDINPEEIPFNQFLDKDLENAARRIKSHMNVFHRPRQTATLAHP